MSVKEIEIKIDNPPIKKGFKLEGLEKINIIVGENGSGKSKLFKSILKEMRDSVLVIPASEIKLDEVAKTTADSSLFIQQLAKLLGNTTVNVQDQGVIRNVLTGIKENISQFGLPLEINLEGNTNIKGEWVARTFLSGLEIKENDQSFGLKDLAQGHQRIFILSLLLAMSSDLECKEKPIILIEEPEIFLHMKLKEKMNEKILELGEKGYQIIFSTHDTFFLYSNMKSDNVKIFSLKKEKGETTVSSEGIDSVIDEMLHIHLYSEIKDVIDETTLFPIFKRSYIKESSGYQKLPLPKFIRNQIHHPENTHTIGISDSSANDEKNYYTHKELQDSINLMLGVIQKNRGILQNGLYEE